MAKTMDYNPKEINTFNALAILDVCDQRLVKRMCVEAMGKITHFSSVDIASTLNGLARLGMWEELVDGLRAEAPNKISDFGPQEISNTLNALAKFGVNQSA
jgi:hypothetical protein